MAYSLFQVIAAKCKLSGAQELKNLNAINGVQHHVYDLAVPLRQCVQLATYLKRVG